MFHTQDCLIRYGNASAEDNLHLLLISINYIPQIFTNYLFQ